MGEETLSPECNEDPPGRWKSFHAQSTVQSRKRGLTHGELGCLEGLHSPFSILPFFRSSVLASFRGLESGFGPSLVLPAWIPIGWRLALDFHTALSCWEFAPFVSCLGTKSKATAVPHFWGSACVRIESSTPAATRLA